VIRALEARPTTPFVPEALAWYVSRGRPTDASRRLDALVEIRNDEAHGRALSEGEQDERAGQILGELRAVLSDMAFLARYRPFRILQRWRGPAGSRGGSSSWSAPRRSPSRSARPGRPACSRRACT
jgi:hypothetical protein